MDSYDISKIAKTYTDYDVISAHTELPEFPKHRINLLTVFLKNGALASSEGDDEHELYALAISLMQMGLDTHDMVESHNEPINEQKMRSNQLKVLAGDYFSSRFYQLLAKKGRIDFIQRISQAIGELNRIKMNFYLNLRAMRMTAEDFIHQSIQIKTQLFTPFSQMMKAPFSEKWSKLLHGIAQCEVIAEQIERHDSEMGDINSWSFWYKQKHGNEHDLRPTLLAMLGQQLEQLHEQVKHLSSEKMIQELSHIGEPFLKYFEAQPTGQEI